MNNAFVPLEQRVLNDPLSSVPLIRIFFVFSCSPESEFNEFEPRLKSAKNQFRLSAGINLETLNKILSGTNHKRAASQGGAGVDTKRITLRKI